MAVYIYKGDKQLGPYTMTEVQALVHSGELLETDLTGEESSAARIPLNQLPGFISATSSSPAEPSVSVPPPAHSPIKSFFKKIGSGFVAICIGIFEFKSLTFAGLKTSLSMLFMIGIYSITFGWAFAVGFVFLLFIHEIGHVAAAWLLGMPVSAPLFIPFVGAFVSTRPPKDAWTEALMAYGGPLTGCIGSWICLIIGLEQNALWLIAIASATFVINLFNMIPLPPFDGGRICAAISTWFWLIGLLLLGVALYHFHSRKNVIILAVVVFCGTLPRLIETFFDPPSEEMQSYYRTSISKRLGLALMYLLLLAALLMGYWIASPHLSSLYADRLRAFKL